MARKEALGLHSLLVRCGILKRSVLYCRVYECKEYFFKRTNTHNMLPKYSLTKNSAKMEGNQEILLVIAAQLIKLPDISQ
jgi:hypothetical protein